MSFNRHYRTLASVFNMCLLISILLIWAGLAHAQDQSQPLAQPLAQPLDFSADELEANQETGIFVAIGNVVFEQGKMTLKADRVEYNRDTGQAVAMGNVVFTDHQGNIHFSDNMTMGSSFSEAFAEPIISRMVDKSWMAGDSGEYYKDDFTLYDNATYTPCDCDYTNGETPIWRFETSTTWHDPKTKTVYHRNIQMKVLDLPVMYFPFLSHPDWSVRRRSGLLYPSISYSSDHGMKYIQSYYHVINDTSDVEITPYLFQNSGLLSSIRYRQLWDQSGLDMYLTGGQVESFEKDDQNVLAVDARFYTIVGENWDTTARLYRTSQDTFMRRYGIDNATQHKSTFKAEQIGVNTYNLVEAYDIQGLDSTETDEKEPTVLPSVFHESHIPGYRENMTTRIRLSASQTDNDEDYDINRWSAELYTNEDMAFSTGIFSLETRTALQYHMIEHSPDSNSYIGELGQGSVSAGLGWSQPYAAVIGNNSAIIRPKLKLITVHSTDRTDNIPNRDSSDFHLDEANLFLIHRYQGNDYIKTGTHMAGGVSTDMTETPLGDLSGFVGASYRLIGDVNSGLNATSDTEKLSDILASIQVKPTDQLRFSFAGRFNHEDLELNESRASVAWSRPGTSMSASYNQRSESFFSAASVDEEELIVNLSHLIDDGYTIKANQTFDLTDGKSERDKSTIGLDITRGLQNCLTISIQYTRDETTDRDIKPVDEIMFLMNFKYLGAFENNSLAN